jgi:hypothetical protein
MCAGIVKKALVVLPYTNDENYQKRNNSYWWKISITKHALSPL